MLKDLGFFAIISHHNMVETSSMLSLSSTTDMTAVIPSFTVWIKCFAETQVLQDETGEVILVFYGQVCNDVSLSCFLETYRTRGILSVESLNGSFSFLLIDKLRDKVVLATDRLCSRKVYMRQKESMTVVSTVLKHLFTDDLSIDPIGLAWHLSNGVVHNNRTIFEGISVLDRASCYAFHADTPVQVRQYWQYQFTDEYAHKDIARVRNEFEALLIESVRRRIEDDSSVLLSLSAGYDASGILGILSEKLDMDNLCSFSYGLNEDNEESDAYISRRLAEMCGIEHQFLLSYDGDLCGAIERNALWGGGVAHFCDESLVWGTLRDNYADQNYTLFVGQHCFGWKDVELFSNKDILAACMIRDFTCLGWLKRFLPHDVYSMLLDGQNEDISTLLRRIPRTKDLHDVKDHLYLDQRLCHVMLPWREHFGCRTFRVQNPFLDNDILDFMRKLPSRLRRGKRFYKETITSMFPTIFAIERAKVGSYVPDWTQEVLAKKGLIIARYLPSGHSSMLDEFIAPDSVIELLSMEEEIPGRVGLAVENVISLPYRAVNKALREVGAREIRRRKMFTLGRTVFLLRYLVLRRFLEIAERDSILLKLTLDM